MSTDPLDKLNASLETFLEYWVEHMDDAGYLAHTPAKREDCIKAFDQVLTTVRQMAPGLEPPDFAQLLLQHRSYAQNLIQGARSHKARGISAESFLGCFKTLQHAMENTLLRMEIPDADKLQGILKLRRVCDMLETVIIGDWEESSTDELMTQLREVNQLLSLKKSRYENIFRSTSDLVLITDPQGRITEANPEAAGYFPDGELTGTLFWELLGLAGESLEEVLHRFPLDESCEMAPPCCDSVFTLRIVPLGRDSLAFSGFMVILNDITCLVDHRKQMEKRVAERTQALADSEEMLRIIFESVGNGILVIDEDMEIVKANQRAAEIYGFPLQNLIGQEIGNLTGEDGSNTLLRFTETLVENQVLSAEITGIYVDGGTFLTKVKGTRIAINGKPFWPLIVRDISEQKALEEKLRQEKIQTDEMNVTLKNVMRSIESERKGFEEGIAGKIKSNLLPALEKVRNESEESIRSSYLDLVREQLISLTGGFESELDAGLLKLSRTEIRICRFIQAGSTTKEICEAMHLANDTVQTHRKNIRKKLGLSGKSVNLHSYLAGMKKEPGQ